VIALIWDMDGVLVDSGRAHYEAWRRLFGELGRSVTEEQVAETLGMANEAILRLWLGDEPTRAEIDALADRKEASFRELVGAHMRVLPGVETWLERARQRGYRQAVASSAPMANIVAVVEGLGLADAFDLLISGARLPRSKPDPAIFLQAAGGLGAVPAGCVVLEDAVQGVEAALRAEMRCIAVTNTRSAQDLAAATRVVASLEELEPDAIERLLAT
jgi:HAD superfamily hydrolase (TIGR01509 family)